MPCEYKKKAKILGKVSIKEINCANIKGEQFGVLNECNG